MVVGYTHDCDSIGIFFLNVCISNVFVVVIAFIDNLLVIEIRL